MSYLFENGSWSLRGTVVSSYFLAAIWLLELGTIAFIPVSSAVGMAGLLFLKLKILG